MPSAGRGVSGRHAPRLRGHVEVADRSIEHPCSLPPVGYHGFMQPLHVENLARQLLQGEISRRTIRRSGVRADNRRVGRNAIGSRPSSPLRLPRGGFRPGQDLAAMEKIFQTQSPTDGRAGHPDDGGTGRRTVGKFPQAHYNPMGRTFRISRPTTAANRTAAG